MNRKPKPWGLGWYVALFAAAGCTTKRQPVAPAGESLAPVTNDSAEFYRSNNAPQVSSLPLYLPGSATRSLVTYQAVDGLAVMEGDIVLGPAHTLLQRYGAPRASLGVKSAVVVADRSYLWPNAEIPYEIDASAREQQADINWAIEHLSTTPLKVRPRTAADADYVVFSNKDSGCWSELGRMQGPQTIQLEPDCGRGSTVHEILHAAGFMHEQARSDRDQYVTIVWDEIVPGREHNFAQHPKLLQDVGAYDYDSILHYGTRSFSARGRPTIVPKDPNARIGNRAGLSALDRAAIEQVYGGSVGSSPAPVAPSPAPTPAAIPAPAPAPPAPTPPAPRPPAPQVVAGVFAGTYSSELGPVTCSQNSNTVQCNFRDGSLLCSANGVQLDCGWSGRGMGRAVFTQQPNGVLAGTWGDAFSTNSRGKWTLAPAPGGQPPGAVAPAPVTPAPVPPAPVPAPVPPAPAGNVAVSLTGNYASSRGNMTCSDAGARLTCDFRDPAGVPGRLECDKQNNGLQLSCTWATFLPQPAGGRAVLTRPNVNSRTFTGTWGHFLAESGGGVWNAQGQ